MAVNSAQFNMGICGRCVAVRGTGSRATGLTVIMKVCDECATCAYGDLDFTTMVREGIQGPCRRQKLKAQRLPSVLRHLTRRLPHPPFSQGANAVTGYAFDKQSIEWWW